MGNYLIEHHLTQMMLLSKELLKQSPHLRMQVRENRYLERSQCLPRLRPPHQRLILQKSP